MTTPIIQGMVEGMPYFIDASQVVAFFSGDARNNNMMTIVFNGGRTFDIGYVHKEHAQELFDAIIMRKQLLCGAEPDAEPDAEPMPEAVDLGADDDIQLCERNLIYSALCRHGGNRKATAAELGISERTLYRKITEYNL